MMLQTIYVRRRKQGDYWCCVKAGGGLLAPTRREGLATLRKALDLSPDCHIVELNQDSEVAFR